MACPRLGPPRTWLARRERRAVLGFGAAGGPQRSARHRRHQRRLRGGRLGCSAPPPSASTSSASASPSCSSSASSRSSRQVTYPVYTRLNGDRARLGRAYLLALRVQSLCGPQRRHHRRRALAGAGARPLRRAVRRLRHRHAGDRRLRGARLALDRRDRPLQGRRQAALRSDARGRPSRRARPHARRGHAVGPDRGRGGGRPRRPGLRRRRAAAGLPPAGPALVCAGRHPARPGPGRSGRRHGRLAGHGGAGGRARRGDDGAGRRSPPGSRRPVSSW